MKLYRLIDFLLWGSVGLLTAFFILDFPSPIVAKIRISGAIKPAEYDMEAIGRFISLSNNKNSSVEMTSTNIKLIGIVNSSEMYNSSALIDIDGYPLKHYRFSTKLPTGEKIEKIESKSITMLSKNGVSVEINLEKSQNN